MIYKWESELKKSSGNQEEFPGKDDCKRSRHLLAEKENVKGAGQNLTKAIVTGFLRLNPTTTKTAEETIKK
jgi:hypothetical protein